MRRGRSLLKTFDGDGFFVFSFQNVIRPEKNMRKANNTSPNRLQNLQR